MGTDKFSLVLWSKVALLEAHLLRCHKDHQVPLRRANMCREMDKKENGNCSCAVEKGRTGDKTAVEEQADVRGLRSHLRPYVV